jgi:alpha-ribazole phosphatase
MIERHLHLLRHGAPETPNLLLGRTDVASTEAGIVRCVEQIADLSFDTIISSDLKRTASAAAAIAAVSKVSVTIDPRWRELDFGAWDGRATSEIDIDALARFWKDPDGCSPPDGECWSALIGRVGAALADCGSPSTLVVTHGGAIRAALAALCGFDHRQLWAFDLPYGVLVSLRVWPSDQPSARIVALAP